MAVPIAHFQQGNSLDIKLYTKYSTSARSDCSVGVESREWCGGGEGSTLSLSHSLPLSPLSLTAGSRPESACTTTVGRWWVAGWGGGLTMTKLFTNFNFYNRIKGVLILRIKEQRLRHNEWNLFKIRHPYKNYKLNAK